MSDSRVERNKAVFRLLLEYAMPNWPSRSVTVTAEGKEYYCHAVKVVADIDAADNAVRVKKNKPQGHLRVDVQVSFAHNLLIPALPEFHQEYPDITIALGINDKTINIVGEGVDCAIRAGKIQDLSLVARKITDMEYVTCASPAYLKSNGAPQTPQEVKDRHKKIIYFSSTTGKIVPLTFTRKEETIEIVDSQFSANEGDGVINLMLAGLGISQHLRAFVQPHLDSGRLVHILKDWYQPPLPFYVVYRQNTHQSTRFSVFINWLIERFGQPQTFVSGHINL
ncbi:LysR family transcriptional regulator [Photorhabdus luminescens]|uniref:LysR family transcriptional regulator n=1 Tax=Photorhabdus luminescens subsp. mexicana TaxID=2100167 RepID=A0A4V2X4F0_PHOLU|nr:LysR substrate-binding domain-containing protein [Photorhabdus luminescens]TDB44035.1 LysR family transcriptional regulator [Photorhabdus luminescens subsp. mexicana]